MKRKKVKGNEVGFKQNQQNRDIALGMLDTLTKKREADGYLWVKRGSTTKQIHPDKLEAHLADGWKVKKT